MEAQGTNSGIGTRVFLAPVRCFQFFSTEGNGALTDTYHKESFGVSPKYSIKSDIYSLGCLLYNMCTGQFPRNPPQWSGAVVPISEEYPRELRNIIMQCLEVNPARRPVSRDVVEEVNKAIRALPWDECFAFALLTQQDVSRLRNGFFSRVTNDSPTMLSCGSC